jgi:dienelactone hydrolase
VDAERLSFPSQRGGDVPVLLTRPADRRAAGAALYFHHGGQQTTGQFLDEATELAALGIAAMFLDAPWLRPENAGKSAVANAFAFFEQAGVDLVRAVDVLAAMPDVDGERIAYVGHDLGAHLGAVVAAKAAVKAVVLMAGSARMSEAMLAGNHPFWIGPPVPNPLDLRAAAGEMTSLDAENTIRKSRVTVFHQFGTQDPLVTPDMAKQYADLTPEPKIVRYYDADHGLNEEARHDRIAFLESVLEGAHAR